MRTLGLLVSVTFLPVGTIACGPDRGEPTEDVGATGESGSAADSSSDASATPVDPSSSTSDAGDENTSPEDGTDEGTEDSTDDGSSSAESDSDDTGAPAVFPFECGASRWLDFPVAAVAVGPGEVGYVIGFDGDTALRYDADDEREWSLAWPTAGSLQTRAIAVSPSGDVYVTGGVRGGMLDDTPIDAVDTELFVSKFTADGTRMWTRTWNPAWGGERGVAIAATDDAVYVAGEAGANTGSERVVLAAWSSDGETRWSIDEERGLTYARGIAVVDEHLYAVGFSLTPPGGDVFMEAYLTKWSLEGSHVWTERWSLDQSTYALALAATAERIVVVGTARVDSGDVDVEGPGAFAIEYDAAGERRWANRWGEGGGARFDALAMLPNGDAIAAGHHPPAEGSPTGGSVFVARLGADESVALDGWDVSEHYDAGRSLAPLADGRLLMGGSRDADTGFVGVWCPDR